MNDFVTAITSRLYATFNPKELGIEIAGLFEKLIVAGATFLAFYLLWLIVRGVIRQALSRGHVDETAKRFTLTIVKIVILAVGLVNALTAVGIDTASALTSLGIAGITIGFAARDGLSNLISGIFIFWDRPFVIGDLIEADGHYGKVDDITLRATRVITPDGKMLSIPNSAMVNSTVASYTNFPHLRLDIDVTVGVNEDISNVRKLLLAIVTADEAFLTEPEPVVTVQELGDYNITVKLAVWLADERTHVEKRADLREQVYRTLCEAGVEMPYETISLTPLELRAA